MATQLQNNVRYGCRNKCAFGFWRNVVSDGADWTSAGRLFQSRGPAAAKQRSPTVTRRDGRTSRRLEVDERSRPRRFIVRSATYCSRSDKYGGAVPWRAQYSDRQFELDALGCSRSQWKLATASATCSERRRPAIDRAAALRTDWRRLSRQAVRPAIVALP